MLKHIIFILMLINISSARAEMEFISVGTPLRTPSSEKEMTATSEELKETFVKKEIKAVEEKESDSYQFSLQWSNHLLQGNVYLGNVGTPAEFNSYSIEGLFKKNNFLYQLSFDHLYNTESIKIYNLGTALGLYKELGRFEVSGYLGVAASNYQEKSRMQDVNATSLAVTGTVALNYYLTESFYLNTNYKYYHIMFNNGFKFWGENPRSDVVFDLKGLGIGLGWRF